MKWHRLFAGLALGLVCSACSRDETAPAIESGAGEGAIWLTDFPEAQARARRENRMLLINFTGSDWCPPCIMLHRQIFAQKQFAEYAAEKLVLLEIDFPRTKKQNAALKAANEKLASRFGVYAFPTVIVLDSAGKKLGELGYMRGGPAAFIAALEKLPGQS